MTENKDALLPCPFCGGDELSHGWSSPGIDGTSSTGSVECHSCSALVYCTTESDAIAAWNTRATPPAQDAMREAFVAESVLTISGQCMGHADAVREISRTLDLDASEERIIEEIIGNVVRLERANAKGHLDFAADERDRTIFLARLLGQAREYVTDAIDAMAHSDGSDLLAEIDAALSAPNVAGERDYTRERIAELVAEEYGTWRPCSGCQESVDGCVSTADYPFSEQFQCQPGGGCRECGGIGVIWDTTDYEDMARFCLSTPQPESVGDARAALKEAIEIVRLFHGFETGEDRVNPGLGPKFRDRVRDFLAAQVVAKHGEGR